MLCDRGQAGVCRRIDRSESAAPNLVRQIGLRRAFARVGLKPASRRSGLPAVPASATAALIVAEALHGSAPADAPELLAAVTGEPAAIWSITPAAPVLGQSSPRFTPGAEPRDPAPSLNHCRHVLVPRGGWPGPIFGSVNSRGPNDLRGGDARARLRRALRAALRARDMTAVLALRSALGAIGNAEAIEPGAAPSLGSSRHVAGTVAGLGAGEARRRHLSEQELCEIVQAEVAEREAAARDYQRAGRAGHAGRLRREAQVLTSAIRDDGRP